MNLTVFRKYLTDKSTVGELWIDGVFFCFTLEPADRGLNARHTAAEVMAMKRVHPQGRTAIPTGRYRIRLTLSRRFKTVLPEITPVPGFLGIRLHVGNYPHQTEGCVLVGAIYEPDSPDFIGRSKSTVERLIDLLETGGSGQDWIEYTYADDVRDSRTAKFPVGA